MAPRDPLSKLRTLCLALPEAAEKIAWGEPTFRVRDKIFAMYDNNHHEAGHIAVWCKAPPGVQEILVNADPKKFFRPPYVGHKGWIGVRLDRHVDWDESPTSSKTLPHDGAETSVRCPAAGPLGRRAMMTDASRLRIMRHESDLGSWMLVLCGPHPRPASVCPGLRRHGEPHRLSARTPSAPPVMQR